MITVLFFFGTGCARQAKVKIDIETRSKLPSPVVERLEAAGKIRTIKAYAEGELEYRRRRKRFDAVIVVKPPDRLRLDIIDPLAGVVASIIFSQDVLTYSDSSGMKVWSGADSEKAFMERLKLPFGPDEVIRVFAGGIPDPIDLRGIFPRDRECRYWIDDQKSALSLSDLGEGMKYIKVYRKRISAEIEYRGYRKIGRIMFPHELTVRIARPKGFFRLKFKDVELNSPIGKSPFEKGGFRGILK